MALACAGLAAALSLGGRFAGHSLSLAGYSDDAAVRRITIGSDRLAVPANMIRHARARQDGPAKRLDLYLRWPQMDGFSEAARDDFNNKDGSRRLLFLSFEARSMSRDMSGRLEPIYRSLTEGSGRAWTGDSIAYDFKPDSGYVGEMLVMRTQPGGEPLVARCLSGQAAAESLASCERDISVGRELSLIYRFPPEMLGQWPAVEAGVRRAAASLLDGT